MVKFLRSTKALAVRSLKDSVATVQKQLKQLLTSAKTIVGQALLVITQVALTRANGSSLMLAKKIGLVMKNLRKFRGENG